MRRSGLRSTPEHPRDRRRRHIQQFEQPVPGAHQLHVTKVGRPRFIAGVNDLPQLLNAWHPAVQSSLAVTPTA